MWKAVKSGWGVLDPSLRRRFPFMLGSVILLSALETLGISIVLPVVLLLIEPQKAMTQPMLKGLYDAFGFQSPHHFTALLVVCMITALILKNLASITVYRWQFRVMQRAAADFSTQMFEKYLLMPYVETLTRSVSFFIYVTNSLGSLVSSNFVYQLVLIVSETMTAVFLFGVLLYANPIAALSAFGVLAAAGGTIYFSTARKLSETGAENREASQRTLAIVTETFGNFKEIRVLGRGRRFLEKFQTETDRLATNRALQMLYSASTRNLVEIAMLISIAAFVGVTLAGQSPSASIGLISLFGASALRILPSISRILAAMQALRTSESPIALASEELVHLANWKLEPAEAIAAPVPGKVRKEVSLRLENLGFQYQSALEPAISGVNLDIPFGKSLGIVGSSGSGKTTLADLMLGLITPSAGRVLADGQSISDDLIGWRRKVAYVPQQIGFAAGTIRSNVGLGLRDDEIDDERIASALETAQLASLVARLPLGVNAPIGEAGKLLSGGERQRLGIARALYQNASVLVLDEATSALDVETEDRFVSLLRNLRGVCTTLIIAHRLRTIRSCDRIAMFDSGKLIAVDGFEGLVAKEPRFARLVELSDLDGGGDGADTAVAVASGAGGR